MSTVSYDVKTILIKAGQTVAIQSAGQYVKILRVTPQPNQITVLTDNGAKFNMVPGQGLPVKFKSLTFSCSNQIIDVTAIVYVGDIPLDDAKMIQPGSTLITVDWFTLLAQSAGQFLGSLTVQGTNYRRKSIELINLTGGPSGNPAVNGVITTPFSAKTAFKQTVGTASWTGQLRILPPATAAQNFPMLIETDDTINLSTYQLTGPLDVGVVQLWEPVIS